MAYHGIIWGLLSNDVGKAIRHSWALWLSLPCFHPPWESAGLGALEPWRATLGLPCLVPHKGEKLFRKQKVVCHRENMHVIEKIFSGSFFFSSWCFPWFANHRFQLASNWEVHWIDDGRRWHWQSCPEMIQLRRRQRQPWTSRAVKDSCHTRGRRGRRNRVILADVFKYDILFVLCIYI
jgi:hypothetical protein